MHIRHYCIHIPMHLRICHCKQCIRTVYKRRSGSKCHQGIHIRCPVDQSFESTDEKLLVDHHDCNRQKHL